ncbi:metallophosphoesterase family protein [Propionibacterium sp.]|uniref:metallophosphoesterase family protein n=1 Tax=Propionibacterium sp. TaxID=1977903 RepID=UPI0039E86175
MRFVASADWQLGMTAHYLDAEARPRFHHARLEAVRRIGELAAGCGAEFVLVCGDVFESNQLNRSIIARTFEVLRTFTMPVVLLPGNHDALDAASIYDSPAFSDSPPEQLHVIRDNHPFEVAPGVQIVGAPWFSKHPLHDLVAEACAPLEVTTAGMTRVIAGHGAVSTLNPDRESPETIDVAALTAVLDSGRADVAVLGDRHSTTSVSSRIWYPGTPEVTARRETDPGNALVVDVEPSSHAVSVQKVHIGRWHFTTLEQTLTGIDDVDAVAERLSSLPEKDCTAVWLALSGTLSTAGKARLDDVVDRAGDLFARLDYWERNTDLAVLPDQHDFSDLELSGFAREALDELIVTAGSPGPQAGTAKDALGLLYRFSGGESETGVENARRAGGGDAKRLGGES